MFKSIFYFYICKDSKFNATLVITCRLEFQKVYRKFKNVYIYIIQYIYIYIFLFSYSYYFVYKTKI